MGDRVEPGWGLLLIDTRLRPEAEVAQGATSVESSYTQAGPIPGVPEPVDVASTWRPQVSTHQDQDLEALVLRGGYPGQDRAGRPAAAIAVRLATATTETEWHGWDDPCTVRGWTSAPSIFGSAASVEAIAAVAIPSTQQLVLYTCATGGTSRVLSTYDPRQETWTEDTGVLSGVAVPTPICLAYDEQAGRLILYGGSGAAYDADTIALASTDGGATWDLYSRGLYDETTLAGRTTVATQVNRPWVMLRAAGGGLGQFASIDHGVTWQRVDSAPGTIEGSEARVAALRSGGYLVVYIEVTSSDLKCRRLASASDLWSDAEAVLISEDRSTCAVAVDADGVVYVYSTSTTTQSAIRCHRSLDEGVTWESYVWGVATGAVNTSWPDLVHAVPVAGQVALIAMAPNGAADVTTSAHVLLLGGWSTVESGVGETESWDRLYRLGYGVNDVPGITAGICWCPIEEPQNYGWTAVSAAGTATFTTSSGCGMRVQTTAAQHSWSGSLGSSRALSGELQLSVLGGASSGGGNLVRVTMADAGSTYEYRAEIRISTAAVRVVDLNGALDTSSSTIATMGTTGVRIRWTMTRRAAAAYLTVVYREEGTSAWTVLVDQQALTVDATPTATFDSVLWGVVGASSCDAIWRLCAAAPGGDWCLGVEDAGDLYDSPWTDGHLGLAFGRSVPGAGGSYPLPLAAVTTYTAGEPTPCPRVSATGGPARVGETTDLPTAYTRPWSYVYPALAPSPSRYWEATGTDEVRAVWDLGSASSEWLGDALGLVAVGLYARQVTLEYHDGASWQTAGTLDLSLSAGTALNCTRTGSVVYPRAGTTAVARYLVEGELVGGYAVLSAGAGYVARRIVRQSAGYWSAAAHQAVRVTLEGVTGAEDTAGTVDLVAPGGVLVAYPTAVQVRRLWRVRIASGQTVPGSAYRAGVLGVGRVVGLGADPGWDWRRGATYAREVSRDRAGRVRSIRELGAPREVLSYAWAEGLDLRTLRSSQTPDYVAASGGLAIGSAEDAVSLLGLLEHGLRSGQVPCVVLPRLPAATGTLLDPSLWLYGALVSDSVGLSGVLGTEGTDEVVRLDGAAFERLR